MPKIGKKHKEALKLLEPGKQYEPAEAIELLKKVSYVKFDETVEIAVKLGVDPRHADQMVRGAVVLPNGTGQSATVLAFAKGDKAREAKEAGADYVGAEELAEKIQGGWLEFDKAVATPDMMSVVGRLGRILGPRGLMPNPRTGTVTNDIAGAINEIKQGKIEFRTERTGLVHTRLGKLHLKQTRYWKTTMRLWKPFTCKTSGSKRSVCKGRDPFQYNGPGSPYSDQQDYPASSLMLTI